MMTKFRAIFLLALIFGFAADLRAQQAPPIFSSNVVTPMVTLPASNAVPQVTNFFGSAAVYGTTPYYYWFVSRTASNVSTPAGPLVVQAPASLSSVNNISVSWTPVSGVASYDVLRTATSTTPTGACNCAVALAATLATLTDTGAALQSYTVATTGFNFTIENKILNGIQSLTATYQGVDFQLAPSSGGSNASTVSPTQFGAKADVKYVYDATFSSGSPTVSCPDCNFTVADVGKIAFGTTMPSAVGGTGNTAGNATVLAQTTIIGFTSSTQVTVGANASANCTPGGVPALCTFAWGSQDDTSAINQAVNAAWSGNSGKCQAVKLTGVSFISATVFYVTNANLNGACGGLHSGVQAADATQTGPEVFGDGPGNTGLIPLPSFVPNAANCQAGNGGASCIGGTPNMEAHDFFINGLGIGGTTSAAVSLFQLPGNVPGGCTGSTGFNLTLSNWGPNVGTSIGLDEGNGACGDPYYWNNVSEMFGSTNCSYNSGGNVVMTVSAQACFGANTNSLLVTGNTGVVNSYGSYYLGQLSAVNGQTVQINCAGCTFNEFGDAMRSQFPAGSSGGAIALFVNCANCRVNLEDMPGVQLNPGNSGGTNTVIFVGAGSGGASVHLRNVNLTATGTFNRIFNETATNSIYDDGGNTFTNGTLANSFLGNYWGNGSITGTVATAGSFGGATGMGTGTTFTVGLGGGDAGDSRQGVVTINYAGTPTTTQTFQFTYPTPFIVIPACTVTPIAVSGASFPTSITTTVSSTTLTTWGLTFSSAPASGNTLTLRYLCLGPGI